jgi:hypothetical protein
LCKTFASFAVSLLFFNRRVHKGCAKVAEFFLCVLCVKPLRCLQFNPCSFNRRVRKEGAKVAEFPLRPLRKTFAFFAVSLLFFNRRVRKEGAKVAEFPLRPLRKTFAFFAVRLLFF